MSKYKSFELMGIIGLDLSIVMLVFIFAWYTQTPGWLELFQ